MDRRLGENKDRVAGRVEGDGRVRNESKRLAKDAALHRLRRPGGGRHQRVSHARPKGGVTLDLEGTDHRAGCPDVAVPPDGRDQPIIAGDEVRRALRLLGVGREIVRGWRGVVGLVNPGHVVRHRRSIDDRYLQGERLAIQEICRRRGGQFHRRDQPKLRPRWTEVRRPRREYTIHDVGFFDHPGFHSLEVTGALHAAEVSPGEDELVSGDA